MDASTLTLAQEAIADYGYWAVYLGTMWDHSGLQLFGVAGGVMASAAMEKTLAFPAVVLACGLGSLTSDLIFWFLGRWRSDWLFRIVRKDASRMRLTIIGEGFAKWRFPILTFGRFLPWLGRFVPAAAGLEKIPLRLSILPLVCGSAFSAALYAGLGYWFADLIHHAEGLVFWLAVVALILSVPASALALKSLNRKVEARLHARRILNEEATPDA